MDYVRCAACNAPVTPGRKSCPRCGEQLNGGAGFISSIVKGASKRLHEYKRQRAINAKERSIKRENQSINNNQKTLSRADLNEAIIEAEKRMEKKKAGNGSGIFSCIFGLLGIFTVGIIFVPLTFITAFIGFIDATRGMNGGGQAINLLGFILGCVGAFMSPSIWILVAGASV
jgi:hypothetical protein